MVGGDLRFASDRRGAHVIGNRVGVSATSVDTYKKTLRWFHARNFDTAKPNGRITVQ